MHASLALIYEYPSLCVACIGIQSPSRSSRVPYISMCTYCIKNIEGLPKQREKKKRHDFKKQTRKEFIKPYWMAFTWKLKRLGHMVRRKAEEEELELETRKKEKEHIFMVWLRGFMFLLRRLGSCFQSNLITPLKITVSEKAMAYYLIKQWVYLVKLWSHCCIVHVANGDILIEKDGILSMEASAMSIHMPPGLCHQDIGNQALIYIKTLAFGGVPSISMQCRREINIYLFTVIDIFSHGCASYWLNCQVTQLMYN